MARVKGWMDLSELGDTASLLAAGWSQNGNQPSRCLVTAEPYHDVQGNGGDYALRIQDNDNYWRTPLLATPLSTFYLRVHFAFNALNYNAYPGIHVGWRKGTNILGYIGMDSLGRTVLYSGATLLGTDPTPMTAGQQYLLEVGITIGNSATYEVRVNGATVISGTGDTQPGTDTDVDNLILYTRESVGSHFNYYDDLAADTATWVGESVITSLSPNNIGNSSELTPSGAGDNWQMVDEIPPNDADYNSTIVANKKDTYAHESLPGAATTVKAVMTVARVARTGSDITRAYLVTRSSGTDYEDAAHIIPTTVSIITKMEEVDPNTSAAWTPGAVNVSELGVRFDA